ncbi:MAG TPA: DUF4365 domain-containing protein [Gemmatimonadaceae bacterium]|nr:DUF4365 domain-containing protein [Gemmatimonadaceae bacterium]
MTAKSKSQAEHAGENAVAAAFAELGWFYRHKARPDFGLDGELEGPTEEGTPNFRFIGVQVKSGPSYFRRPHPAGWWLETEPRHLSLWLQASLPVIVVMYAPDEKRAYWQSIERRHIRRTPRSLLLSVPSAQVVNETALEALTELANAGLPPVQAGNAELEKVLRVRRAESDFQWIAALESDAHVRLEIEEEIQPLHTIHVRLYDDEQLGQADEEWDELLSDTTSLADEIAKHFPWATLSIEEELYAQHDWIRYVGECGTWNTASREYECAEEYDDWRSRQPVGLRPYAETLKGERRLWRLELTLNDFGKTQLQEMEDAERDAYFDEMEDLFTDIPAWGGDGDAAPYYEGDAIEVGPGGLQVVERLVFYAGDEDLVLAAEDGLWTDREKRDVLADTLLAHATGREPTRALADAFLVRFASVFPDPDYGVWTLDSAELDNWLREIGA